MIKAVNVVGFASGNLGVGVATRHIIDALIDAGIHVSVFDIDPGYERKSFSESHKNLFVSDALDLPNDINLFILPPTAIASGVIQRSDLIALMTRPSATNAAFTMWELPALSQSATRALEIFDIVIGTSAFVEASLDFHLSGTRVVHGHQPMSLPPNISANRARFGLPQSAFIVVTTFDPFSDPARKNPIAALDAFCRAFPTEDCVRLIIKVNLAENLIGKSSLGSTLNEIKNRIARDSRVVLISDAMSYSDVLSLYASADAYISLHRAEGFALGLLEAMALGVPVIATGWSGNKSFMRPSHACLVRHVLVPVAATHSAYKKVAKSARVFWAEPDLTDAALWLQRLARKPTLRAEVGARGKAAFERYRDEAASLRFFDDILAVRDFEMYSENSVKRLAELNRRIAIAAQTARVESFGSVGRILLSIGHVFDRRLGWLRG